MLQAEVFLTFSLHTTHYFSFSALTLVDVGIDVGRMTGRASSLLLSSTTFFGRTMGNPA